MDDKNSKNEEKNLPIIEEAYKEVMSIFEKERSTFENRRNSIANNLITQIFWSSAYLDFFPKESLLDQLKPAKIFSKERSGAIKNFCGSDGLFFSCHNDNEKWGCLFLEHLKTLKKSLLFVENDTEEMELRRLRLAYMEEQKYNKVLSYSFNSDDNEETLIIDYFLYKEDYISQIIRYGFWGSYTNILPIRTFHFSPSGGISSITISTPPL